MTTFKHLHAHMTRRRLQNVSKMVLTEILSLCLLFFTSTGNKRCRAGRSATDSKHPTHLAHAFLMRNRRTVDPWVVYRSLYVCTQTQMHGTDLCMHVLSLARLCLWVLQRKLKIIYSPSKFHSQVWSPFHLSLSAW